MFSNAVNRTAGPRSTGAGGSSLGREPEVGVAYVEACGVERGREGQPEPFEHVLVAGGGGVGQGPAQQLVPGNPAAVLGWADSFPADAAWVAGVRVGGGRRLHRHLVFPVVPEVVEVLQDGPGSCDLVKADAILRGQVQVGAGRPVPDLADGELVQMAVLPTHRSLDDGVQLHQGQAAGTSTRRQMTGSALSTSSIRSCSSGSPVAGPPWARPTAHRPSAVTGTMPARRSSRSRAGFTASSPLGEQLDGEPDVAMQAAPPPVQLLVGEILPYGTAATALSTGGRQPLRRQRVRVNVHRRQQRLDSGDEVVVRDRPPPPRGAHCRTELAEHLDHAGEQLQGPVRQPGAFLDRHEIVAPATHQADRPRPLQDDEEPPLLLTAFGPERRNVRSPITGSTTSPVPSRSTSMRASAMVSLPVWVSLRPVRGELGPTG